MDSFALIVLILVRWEFGIRLVYRILFAAGDEYWYGISNEMQFT